MVRHVLLNGCLTAFYTMYFYGTVGFLNAGTLLHNRVADFQYIAPLQANFEPSNGNESGIYIYSSSMSDAHHSIWIVSCILTCFHYVTQLTVYYSS